MFTWFDIVVVFLVLLPAVRGVISGAFRSLLGLTALLLGLWLASGTSALLQRTFPQTTAVSHAAIFLIVTATAYVLVGFLLNLFGKIMKVTFIPPIDPIAGGVIGGAKGLLLATLLIELLAPLPYFKYSLENAFTTRPIHTWGKKGLTWIGAYGPTLHIQSPKLKTPQPQHPGAIKI